MTDYSSIIVRTPNWVGDAVMALPFLHSLRLNAPSSRIAVQTRPILAEFYSHVPAVSQVIILDDDNGRRGLRAVWRNARRLQREKFDLAFCLPPSFGSALIMRVAGVRRRVGHAADRRGWLLSDTLPYHPNGARPHRAESFLQLLDLVWKDPIVDRSLRYDPGDTARTESDALLNPHLSNQVNRILAVAPGAAQPNKMWPPDRFASVCRRWLNQPGSLVMIVGGKGDRTACDATYAGIPSERVVNFCGIGALSLVAALIRRAEVLVGNDSGLSHLAASVGVRVVVISGPGDPAEVAPFSPNAVTVKKSLYCSPCYRNTCYRTDHPLECLDLVDVDQVWDSIHNTVNLRKDPHLHTGET